MLVTTGLLLATWIGWGRAAITITAGPEPGGHEEVQDMIRNSSARAWCRPGEIRQIITHNGCESQELDNMVCLGSCLSYSLPLTLPRNRGEEALNLCETCQPDEFFWVNVTLSCMQDEESFQEVKQVQKITSCKCMTCPGYPSDMRPTSPKDEEVVSGLIDRALSPVEDGKSEGIISSFKDLNEVLSAGSIARHDHPMSVLSLFPGNKGMMVASGPKPEGFQTIKDAAAISMSNYESHPLSLNLVELNEEFPLKYDSLKPFQYENHKVESYEPTEGIKHKGLADIVKNLNKIDIKSMSINEIRAELKKSLN